ncbi:MAG: SOS response-associated peptidase [Myxococcota bacterium]
MCGRFALTSTPEALAERFGLSVLPVWAPRYNVAPEQTLCAIRQGDARPEAVSLRWGWVPAWARDANATPRPINARFETVAEKPSFRDAYAARRCLVPIDGWYEWEKIGGGRQPYWHAVPGESLLVVAALWEHWEGVDGEERESGVLLTVPSVGAAAEHHPRMPLVLAPGSVAPWLEGDEATPSLAALFDASLATRLTTEPVHPRVGSVANDDPSCLERVAPPPRQVSLF